MDAGRVRAESERGRVSPNHRAKPTDTTVTRRHSAVQSAPDAHVTLRYGSQQIPDGQPDVQYRVRQLYVSFSSLFINTVNTINMSMTSITLFLSSAVDIGLIFI